MRVCWHFWAFRCTLQAALDLEDRLTGEHGSGAHKAVPKDVRETKKQHDHEHGRHGGK